MTFLVGEVLGTTGSVVGTLGLLAGDLLNSWVGESLGAVEGIAAGTSGIFTSNGLDWYL